MNKNFLSNGIDMTLFEMQFRPDMNPNNELNFKQS